MQVEAVGARNCILKVSRGFKGETGGCMGLMEADEGSGTAGGGYLTHYGVLLMLYISVCGHIKVGGGLSGVN